MLHIVCFYWQGDRWQEKGYVPPPNHINYHAPFLRRAGLVEAGLPSKYVNALYRGVVRHTKGTEFKFICFTNEKLDLLDGIEVQPFTPPSNMGVLPRLWMFNEAAGLFGHQVLALDLDVIIVNDLSSILRYAGQFCTRSKFKPGQEYKLDGDIISFKANRYNEQRFWDDFVNNKEWAEDMTKGRERFWFRHVTGSTADRWDKVAPGAVVSYKRHARHRKLLPKKMVIVSCHGIPRPHELKEKWALTNWGG